jgi:predicted MPP superfamily phosphohydrolase
MYNDYFYTEKDINDIKIALLSDIHYAPHYKLKILDNLYKQILDNKPNYICITGDVLDNALYHKIDPLIEWLDKLSKLAPVIIVYGNHDTKKGYMHHWEEEQNSYLRNILKNMDNVHFLEDSTWQDNNILFYGYNPSYKHYEIKYESYDSFCHEMEKTHIPFTKETYNILLFHSPINIYKYIYNNKDKPISNTDIILSGHCHNGCVPFWITRIYNKIFKSTRSVINPIRKLFSKYAQGHVYEDIEGFIYQGVTKFSYSSRLFSKLDILYTKKVQFINIKRGTK